jgi:hypothetical protein
VPGRRIAEGHVDGIDVRWEGLLARRPVIEPPSTNTPVAGRARVGATWW